MNVRDAANLMAMTLESYGMSNTSSLLPAEMLLALNASQRRALMEETTWYNNTKQVTGYEYDDDGNVIDVVRDPSFEEPAAITTLGDNFSAPIYLHMAIVYLACSIVAERFGEVPPGNTRPVDWLLSRYNDEMKVARKFKYSTDPEQPMQMKGIDTTFADRTTF